jgi:SAM-dependent methyltransferase
MAPLLCPILTHLKTTLWQSQATRQYRRKLAHDDAFRTWWDAEGSQLVGAHWGHEDVQGEFEQLHVGSQIYEATELLRRRIGPIGDATVLDAGASDGFFLSRLGVQKGVGLNFLHECALKIRAEGFESCLGDVERLPFRNDSFDYVICCETLEHVWNPIAVINELARVCRELICITIPWLPETRITDKPPGWPDVESHIFEFSEADFARVLTHARVRVRYQDRVHVFPRPRNPLVDRLLARAMYPWFFPMLQYYELEPAG